MHLPEKEVDTDLDGEGVVVDAEALEHREFAELGLGSCLCEPATEDASPREVPDPAHGGLPLSLDTNTFPAAWAEQWCPSRSARSSMGANAGGASVDSGGA